MATKKNVSSKEASPVKSVSAGFLYTLAFLEGSIVIFAELLGSKMLNAFYGNSLLVWSCVVSVTISALTAGYFLGGKISRKGDKLKKLAVLFALASFFMCLMPGSFTFLVEKSVENSLLQATLSTAIFLLSPVVVCLGATTPLIIQLISEQNRESGKASGNTYAISTIAGIISTLFVGLYLLPGFGWLSPLLSCGGILIIISFSVRFSTIGGGSLILSLLLVFQNIKEKEVDPNFKTLYTTEGMMGQLKVVDQGFPGYVERFRLLFINGIPQTIFNGDVQNGLSYWEYVHRISAAASLKKGKKALLFGMGGGAIASELQKLGFRLDIVDIDARMNEISQEYFGFKAQKTTSFTVDDARHYIKTHNGKQYDVIVLDICSGEVQPSNVFTEEGIADLKKMIAPDGIILVQYQEKINPDRLSGSQSIARTFAKNKFHVYQNIEKLDIAGVILVCSPRAIDFSRIDSLQLTPNARKQAWMSQFLQRPFDQITHFGKNAVVLVDDRPVLEKINSETIELWRKAMIDNYGTKILR